MARRACAILSLGFILYLYDGATHKPVNHSPFYSFDTSEACEADRQVWTQIAPEWLGACREARK